QRHLGLRPPPAVVALGKVTPQVQLVRFASPALHLVGRQTLSPLSRGSPLGSGTDEALALFVVGACDTQLPPLSVKQIFLQPISQVVDSTVSRRRVPLQRWEQRDTLQT